MLKTIVRGLKESALITKIALRSMSTSPINYGEYVIREAVDNEYRSVVELRADHLWKKMQSQAFPINLEHEALVHGCMEQGTICVVAVGNKVEEKLYGTLNVMLRMNVQEDFHLGNVDPMWHSELPLDGYITDLVVSPFARRRHVATNLLSFGKQIALDSGMKRLFVYTDENNKDVIALNKKFGFERVPTAAKAQVLMGMHL